MEFNNNDAAVCADSTDRQPSADSVGEIDLYDDLIAFADLSPEEQMRLADGQTRASHEKQIVSSDGAESSYSSEPIETQPPVENIEAGTWTEELENQSATEAVEPGLSDTLTAAAPIELAEIEDFEIVTPSGAEAVEHASPEPDEAPVLVEPFDIGRQAAEDTGRIAGREFEAHALIEPSEPETMVAKAGPAFDFELSNVSFKRDEVRGATRGSSPSGPLSGFNLPPNIVYTGALARGICLACGAASGADDLFCITCGSFIDEIVSTLPVNPTCPACKNEIATDEIFCPWCGSVMSAA